jgi:hypothetical protein
LVLLSQRCPNDRDGHEAALFRRRDRDRARDNILHRFVRLARIALVMKHKGRDLALFYIRTA